MGDIDKENAGTSLPRLKVSLGNVMQLSFGKAAKPVKGLYAGMERGSFLILHIPRGADIHDYLYEGCPAVVKYASGGRIYGFQSRVIGYVFNKTLILVVLAYPEAVETHVLRDDDRVDFLAPARLEADGLEVDGFVVDLSAGGCRFAYEPAGAGGAIRFSPGSKVALAFQMMGLDGIRRYACTVKTVSREGRLEALGVKFDAADEDALEGIRRYVSQVSGFLENGGGF